MSKALNSLQELTDSHFADIVNHSYCDNIITGNINVTTLQENIQTNKGKFFVNCISKLSSEGILCTGKLVSWYDYRSCAVPKTNQLKKIILKRNSISKGFCFPHQVDAGTHRLVLGSRVTTYKWLAQTSNSNEYINILHYLIMLNCGSFPIIHFHSTHPKRPVIHKEHPYHVFSALPWEGDKLQNTQCQSLWLADEHLLP